MRFDCIHCRKATTKPQSVKGAFLRMLTVIPPNINGMFIRGYHIKFRYVVVFIVIIVTWAVTASVSSVKYKEESFAHYSMYRAVKEQHQYLIEKVGIELKRNME